MIKLICLGSIKEKYLKDAIEDYQKRLSKYTKFEVIELKEIKEDINKESDKILKKLEKKEYVILLDLKGKQYTTLEMVEKIENLFSFGKSNITFVIGGSNGVNESVKNRANDVISFSKLTFPHQLFRVVFLEQLYRIFKIINNEPYHK